MHCKVVSLDGKVYVLGGEKEYYDLDDVYKSDDTEDGGKKKDDKYSVSRQKEWRGGFDLDRSSSEVYVLDVAGHGGWKQCASLPTPRLSFGCGVVDGKIYVFGGYSSSKPTRSSLVYDPKANAWSSVSSMRHQRSYPTVLTVRQELFVHGGHFRHHRPLFTEVYHPGRDEWRSLEPFGVHEEKCLFHAKGKLHMTTPSGIYRQDVDVDGKYSWALQLTVSFDMVLPGNDYLDYLMEIEEVNDELVGLLACDPDEFQQGICQSKGFGGKKQETSWEMVPCKALGFCDVCYSISPIQL